MLFVTQFQNYHLNLSHTHTFRMCQGPITIHVTIDKFGRCRIGSEVFGSVMSKRNSKSSFVLAKFIINDDQVECYPGQVQYYFTTCQARRQLNITWLLFCGINRQIRQVFDIILTLMMTKKRKHVMSNCENTVLSPFNI